MNVKKIELSKSETHITLCHNKKNPSFKISKDILDIPNYEEIYECNFKGNSETSKGISRCQKLYVYCDTTTNVLRIN